MFETVAVPVWAMVLIGLFATLSVLERVIGPSIRWFFRKRAERVVAELNKRLDRPIEPFKLARRHDMIQRLKHDPEVAQAIAEHAKFQSIPEQVAWTHAERYAREIVPGFSATAYFGFGTRLSKWVSEALFRVRLGPDSDTMMTGIDPDATVIFVINHRSNMDYLLVTWLAAKRSALSYAVGEWARFWPLSPLIRSMGAFFIRRKSRNALYRKVLSRYVQLATSGGVSQAVFPEGGLSLTGQLADLKLGFLSYIVSGYQPGARDVVFVPVALNYERVLEDRILIAAGAAGERKFRASIPTALMFAFRQIGLKLRGRFLRYGEAAVSYGPPLSLTHFMQDNAENTTKHLGQALSKRLTAIIPVLAVPLIATILEDANGPLDAATLEAKVLDRHAALVRSKARVLMPEDALREDIARGVSILKRRRLVEVTAAGTATTPGEEAVMAFYAKSIRHLVDLAEG